MRREGVLPTHTRFDFGLCFHCLRLGRKVTKFCVFILLFISAYDVYNDFELYLAYRSRDLDNCSQSITCGQFPF